MKFSVDREADRPSWKGSEPVYPWYVVYSIRQLSTGCRYVGATRQPFNRWHTHIQLANRPADGPLYQAMHQNLDDFKLSVLCFCSSTTEMFARELELISALGAWWPNGFNREHGAWGRRRREALVDES
jgi:hypothetical protein